MENVKQVDAGIFEKVLFSSMLYGLYKSLQFSSFISSGLKKKILEKDIIFIIKTEGEEVLRKYGFKNGKIFSSTKTVSESDFTMIWKSPGVASGIMIDFARGNMEAVEMSVDSGTLDVEGDAASVTWFLEVVNDMRHIYFK